MSDVTAAWARLGVMFNSAEARRTPDVERLLLDTARLASQNVRLFTLAGAWLKQYGRYVAGHRLAVLIERELEAEHRPTLGMLLDWAGGPPLRFVVKACGRRVDDRPLSEVEARNPTFRKIAAARATPLSKKWGRWLSEAAFEVKPKMLRPIEWVTASNPALRLRALVGSVAASILAEWPEGAEIESEASIVRQFKANPRSVAAALETLQLAGRLTLEPAGRRNIVRLSRAA